MNQETLLGWYNGFEKLIARLPGPIQKAILSEIQPVKELFLEQRVPRILLLGTGGVSRVEVVNSFFHEQVIPLSGEIPATPPPGWETFHRAGRGSVQILDGRGSHSLFWQSGRDAFPPDVVLFLRPEGEMDSTFAEAVERLGNILIEIEIKFKSRPAVIGVLEGLSPENAPSALEAALRSNPAVNKNFACVVSLPRWSRFRADGTSGENEKIDPELNHLLTFLIDELPVPAKLEMARISGIRPAQKKIADTLIKAVTAISAAIGAQPIPLADLPILTGLQSGMVAGIIYISGGELNARSALKFLGALGVNIGLAIVLRESARAAAKLVPGWGYAISGAFAAGGTMALGRAASGFFIDGISLHDARKLFRRKNKKAAPETAKLDDK